MCLYDSSTTFHLIWSEDTTLLAPNTVARRQDQNPAHKGMDHATSIRKRLYFCTLSVSHMTTEMAQRWHNENMTMVQRLVTDQLQSMNK